MTDHITLPRDVALQIRAALMVATTPIPADRHTVKAALDALDAALAEPVHPGYIIGSHWLETAYSRIAAGEAEAEVLTEVLGARGWVKPEPATDEQVAEADESHEPSWIDYRDGWRDAERWHGITKEDKT